MCGSSRSHTALGGGMRYHKLVIMPYLKLCVRCTTHYKVPFENVVLRGNIVPRCYRIPAILSPRSGHTLRLAVSPRGPPPGCLDCRPAEIPSSPVQKNITCEPIMCSLRSNPPPLASCTRKLERSHEDSTRRCPGNDTASWYPMRTPCAGRASHSCVEPEGFASRKGSAR
jgi:hypothetical protein